MYKPEVYWQPIRLGLGLLLLILSLFSACTSASPPTVTPAPQLANELVFYYWANYFPQSVLDDFTREYGIKVRYAVYDSHEEAAQKIRTSDQYDVLIIAPEFIPELVAAGALAKINYQHVANFINIAANFRDLNYDPNNTYSIPFQWGTTGLLVRTDLVKKPISHWADLWDPAFAGKVAVWPIPRALIPIALKKLGYPANSEDPQELEAALQQLLTLKRNATFLSNQIASVVSVLEANEAVIGYGWTYDALTAEQSKLPIKYILPEEGTLLWGENYVIPARSQRQATAELFLNFMLRPDVSAKIINENHSAVPNEPAIAQVQPALRNDPNLFPPAESLRNAELTLPLSPQGQQLWDHIWQRLMASK